MHLAAGHAVAHCAATLARLEPAGCGPLRMIIDYADVRDTMVEQQVRPWDVLDLRVLQALSVVPRDAFVPAAQRALAYVDTALPLPHGEAMMKPVVEGRMLQALELQPGDSVLEIGTGTGFITACLAHLGAKVTSLDIHQDFIDTAGERLREHAPGAVFELQAADALQWNPARRFDAICVTGALAALPSQFLQWLQPGGRLFAVVGRAPAMQAVLVRNDAPGSAPEVLFETDLPYLQGAAPRPMFVL